MAVREPGETTRRTPYYLQIAGILRAKITGTDADRPISLPTERELCAIHHVSRVTISKALDILEREGLV